MTDSPHDWSIRLGPTFVDGVLLTAAAIPDAALIYCGSTCIQEHARDSYRIHDWGQTLIRSGPGTRLMTTFTDYTLAPMGLASVIRENVDRLLEAWRPGLIVLAELSRITIAGDDLKSSAAELAESTGIPTVAASSRYLVRDQDTAFRGLLSAIAGRLPDTAFARGLIPESAAVIGYFHERNEGDQEGNTAELEGMLQDLGLTPVATWLSSTPMARLAEAARASLLVALPQGVEAARVLAERSGATVVETDLPVGIEGTREWLDTVARAAGASHRVADVEKRRLPVVVRRVDWAVSQMLAGRRVVLAASPDWLGPLSRMLVEDLGIDVSSALRRSRLAEGQKEGAQSSTDPLRLHDPSVRTLNARINAERAGRGVDAIIGSSWERIALQGDCSGIPFVEFGFPSFRTHNLLPVPSLGFTGVMTWAERLAAAIGSLDD
ncbi:MAG: hypothetical protein GXP54_11000 [Deltaproteobacteria bacterium]|nr:hypothetical protein [Deltaproteobacteria bacterium]